MDALNLYPKRGLPMAIDAKEVLKIESRRLVAGNQQKAASPDARLASPSTHPEYVDPQIEAAYTVGYLPGIGSCIHREE
jgi:hypothetical protein